MTMLSSLDKLLENFSTEITVVQVPGLYQAEEFETLCSSLKDVSTQHDFQGSPSQFFVERRSNKHYAIPTPNQNFSF